MAIMPGSVLFDLAAGVFRGHWNEFSIDGKPDTHDPVKLRFGAWQSDRSGYLGILSFDLLSGDPDAPRRSERGFIGLAMDPEPTLYIHLQTGTTGEDDSTMKKVATVTARGIEFHVPVRGMAGTNPAPPSILRAPGGQTELHMQGDGNLVTYDVRTNPWTPLWSSMQGKVQDFREDGNYA